MVDVEPEGRRPVFHTGQKLANSDTLEVCPGASLAHPPHMQSDERLIHSLLPAWGPITNLWEGYATDNEMRFSGSSGGVISALSTFALEKVEYAGVLHTAMDLEKPYLNKSVISTSRDDILATTGSRYAPASPCELLEDLVALDGRSMFIGKPCDVAATNKAAKFRPELAEKIGITVAFFCAGTPSTEGTIALLKQMGVPDLDKLKSFRYRGNGWPGLATADHETSDGQSKRTTLTYEESWGDVLTKHVQWRCRLCLDHTGEFADISVGDPWYREIQEGEQGSSLILARTEKGRKFLELAIESGYIVAVPVENHILPDSQPNLVRTRGSVWGRIVALRVLGLRTPHYENMPSFRFWLKNLTFDQKIRSLLGTIRRVVSRKFAR